MHWLFLTTAGLFEVGFTTALKASEGFSKLTPTILFILFAAASFALLNLSMKHITLGTAAVGILVYKEPSGAARLASSASRSSPRPSVSLFVPWGPSGT